MSEKVTITGEEILRIVKEHYTKLNPGKEIDTSRLIGDNIPRIELTIVEKKPLWFTEGHEIEIAFKDGKIPEIGLFPTSFPYRFYDWVREGDKVVGWILVATEEELPGEEDG